MNLSGASFSLQFCPLTDALFNILLGFALILWNPDACGVFVILIIEIPDLELN
jgi:hypothetical protein